jgi:hypothetical protein
MSGPAEEEQDNRASREGTRLRRWSADLASAVAATEDQVADTLEQVAGHRPPSDAERLRAEADRARKYAAKERDLSLKYHMSSGDHDRTRE